MSLSPYLQLMRFHQPVGTLLLFWPVCTAIGLASPPWGDAFTWIIFTLGVIVSRAAGCVINDLWDQPFDAQVARTTQRPLAHHTLSRKQAWACLTALWLCLLPLFFQLNGLAQSYALLAAGLTLIYPACKRFFPFPQLILGLTFNMGVLMVFAQTQNHIPKMGWYLYIASLCWTFSYDTAYALSDKTDDLKLGLYSSAITLGKASENVTVCALLAALYFYLLALNQAPEILLSALFVSSCLLWKWGRAQLRQDPLTFFYRQAIFGGVAAFIVLGQRLLPLLLG